ncbi:hypothetical protein OA92_08730 [Marinomonas sp. SBI22]|uniref:hypothetical protein n=1 Tax=unclassified Marinomonas TaxID=196814 RepID=UPI0007AEFE46|nr:MULTISPECIES: hypothetical protein [unclassified Marinomonas]KZM38790.1 hypothetical protein OA91_23575 [Marinomonas sp. SBI8L]KZM43747.1 hypothetical protein OA92_08730 [Marinomonas sp. SBI22]
MFSEIKINHQEHVLNIEEAYSKSKKLGLSPDFLSYRKLDKNDFNNLFSIIDRLQPVMNYDHLSGACLLVHSNLKEAFAAHGYSSELVFGDIYINGEPHMGCSINTLMEQLNEGVSNKTQKVHCWLLLESGQFFDATIFRDFTGGVYAAELYGYNKSELDGYTFEFKPMLVGNGFLEKTNPIIK